MARRAQGLLPGGGSHDFRQLGEAGPFMLSGQAGRKMDVAGREIIDLTLGHGALMLGHDHKAIRSAIERALARGIHLSATTPAELAWAEAIRALVPAAQRIRFTASGNEALALAVALAKRNTGRERLITLEGHHFGWVLSALGIAIETAPDAASLAQRIDGGAKGHALVMLEPTGGSFGLLPLGKDEAQHIAKAAKASDVPLLFDETITGFRVAPGGAQQVFDVAPDLTVLGKILGAGLPCGALVGSADFLDSLDNRPDAPASHPRLSHGGTHNGNPLVAAAGAAMLGELADGKAIQTANAKAAALRTGLNALFARIGLDWAAYGAFSEVHIFMNPAGEALDPTNWAPSQVPTRHLGARSAPLTQNLRIALLENGVDVNGWPGALTCAAHTSEDMALAEAGFERALVALKAEGAQLTGWAA